MRLTLVPSNVFPKHQTDILRSIMYLFSFFFFLPLSFFSLSNASGLLAFYVVPVVSSTCTMACHCIVCSAYEYCITMKYLLCRGFVTTELGSFEEEESARRLGVLHVDGQKERFNVKNTHALTQSNLETGGECCCSGVIYYA